MIAIAAIVAATAIIDAANAATGADGGVRVVEATGVAENANILRVFPRAFFLGFLSNSVHINVDFCFSCLGDSAAR